MTTEATTDHELLEASRHGDHGAFKELVKRYQGQVAATVIGMLGNGHEADDIGQETFIRFYQSLNQFKENSGISTYLTRIAINLSLNELKRRKRKALLFMMKSHEELENYTDTDVENRKKDDMEVIKKSLLRLEPKFRSVIVLRLIDGYSTAETAEILKVPVGTVLSRLARAQEKLKEIIILLSGGQL